MKVATGGQNQPPFEAGLKFISALLYQFGNETVALACMGRPDDVGNSICNGHLRHGARDIDRFRSIVKTRKYVAVNIDHRFKRE